MLTIFNKTKVLEVKIDAFLDTVLEAAFEFRVGIEYYLKETYDSFNIRKDTVDRLEGKADKLRREIENALYLEMLLPESRGDVLALLETTDDVLNALADMIVDFSIERPVLKDIKEDFLSLTDVCTKAVEEMIATVRAYFKDLVSVRNHIIKVMFLEKESDKIGERIKKHIFNKTNWELSKKIHLTTFVKYLQGIADKAEDVADRVSIYAIKRTE